MVCPQILSSWTNSVNNALFSGSWYPFVSLTSPILHHHNTLHCSTIDGPVVAWMASSSPCPPNRESFAMFLHHSLVVSMISAWPCLIQEIKCIAGADLWYVSCEVSISFRVTVSRRISSIPFWPLMWHSITQHQPLPPFHRHPLLDYVLLCPAL